MSLTRLPVIVLCVFLFAATLTPLSQDVHAVIYAVCALLALADGSLHR